MNEPELMTPDETIAYLRLDVTSRNPREQLRNLTRRFGLPSVGRGKCRLFRRSVVDRWLDGDKSLRLARVPKATQAVKRVATNGSAPTTAARSLRTTGLSTCPTEATAETSPA